SPTVPTAFRKVFNVSVPSGQTFTATATDPTNNTSVLATDISAVGPYVVNTTADSGPGSLRQVIQNANGAAVTPVPITFAIPTSATAPSGVRIQLQTALDPIIKPVTIQGKNTSDPNATSQPDVEIDGSLNSAIGDGLVLAAGSTDSTITDLSFTGFTTG